MNNTEDQIYSEEWIDDPKADPDYSPEMKESVEISEAGSEWSSQQSLCGEGHIESSKLLVFLSLLLVLFQVCREPGCGNTVDRKNIVCSRKGACMTITATCDSHHVTKVIVCDCSLYLYS